MKSLTGHGIRVDGAGSGHYGASRGNRRHNGIDYFCIEGQKVVAPFALRIIRVARPYADSELSGIQWEAGISSGKIFYFKPYEKLIGKTVKTGQAIGIAQSVTERYGFPMSDHIHFQVDQ